jgi:tetratricopeptide (TPR) repeat protein
VDLEQSPVLNFVPDQKLRETLQLMGRAPEEHIITAIGREICLRKGIKAMLTGSVSNLGGNLDTISAATGDTLGKEQVQASRKEDILNALGKATSGMRQKLGETYPRDSLPWGHLCNSYAGLAQFEKSVSYCQEEVRLDPSRASSWENPAEKYRALNRFDEAKAAIESAIERGQHSWGLPAELVRLNAAQGQTTGEEDLRRQIQASPEGAFHLIIFDPGMAAAQGRLEHARELLQDTENSAARLNLKEAASDAVAVLATFLGFCDDRHGAEQLASHALTLAHPDRTKFDAAAAYALAGQENKAQLLAQEVAHGRPDNMLVQVFVPATVQALIVRNHSNADRALELLRPAAAYDAT